LEAVLGQVVSFEKPNLCLAGGIFWKLPGLAAVIQELMDFTVGSGGFALRNQHGPAFGRISVGIKAWV
jgi:hypothetical protein